MAWHSLMPCAPTQPAKQGRGTAKLGAPTRMLIRGTALLGSFMYNFVGSFKAKTPLPDDGEFQRGCQRHVDKSAK